MPRKTNAWHRALKEWNRDSNKGKWCIPKRGSADHRKVKEIQRRLEGKRPRYAKRTRR